MECEISHSLHPRGMCVHVLVCARRSQQEADLDMSREDLFERS